MSGKSARFWKISAVGRWFGRRPRTSVPPIRITPVDGSMKPDIMRRMVVLPQPDGPRNEKNSPGLMWTVTWSTALKVPKSAQTPSRSTPALIRAPVPLYD
jgi:hypothetical protein